MELQHSRHSHPAPPLLSRTALAPAPGHAHTPHAPSRTTATSHLILP
jgi:hypothetical protein